MANFFQVFWSFEDIYCGQDPQFNFYYFFVYFICFILFLLKNNKT